MIGNCRWEAVALAHGYLETQVLGATQESVSEVIRERCRSSSNNPRWSAKKARELATKLQSGSLLSLLIPRTRTGISENPITKMFPSAVTERLFENALIGLCQKRSELAYTDDRLHARGLSDFTLSEDGTSLPLNVKHAGARFREARRLVGLDPDDCLPIPVYKAHLAVAKLPDLIYAISVNYDLPHLLSSQLNSRFDRDERIVWELISKNQGTYLKDAEDLFVFEMVKKYWNQLAPYVEDTSFHAISARRVVTLFRELPKRTPGVGIGRWGNSARAEINVHVSIRQETIPWHDIEDTIVREGLSRVIADISYKRRVMINDPKL